MTVQLVQPSPSHKIIAATLDANNGQLWKQFYLARSAVIIAATARSMLHVLPYQLTPDWERLDDGPFRESLLQAVPTARDVADDLAALQPFLVALTTALAAVPLKPPSRNQLIQVLEPLLAQRIPSHRSTVAAALPLHMVWAHISDILAQDLYHLYCTTCAESSILQQALLTAFFQASRIPTASAVRGRLAAVYRSSLELRGGLLRIPQQMGDRGIMEPPLSHTPWNVPPLDAGHQALSAILASVPYEASQIPPRRGFIHRTLKLDAAVDPSIQLPAGMTHAEVQIARTAAWRQYEYSGLVLTAITSIEFLIRSAAEWRHLPQDTVVKMVSALTMPGTEVESLFGTDGFSLRAKSLHGAFLEIESRRTEINMALPFAPRLGLPALNLQNDRFLPESAAAAVLNILGQVDAWVATNIPHRPSPLAWRQPFLFTAHEHQQALGWHNHTVYRWDAIYNRTRQLLQSVFPALSVPVQLGLQGWVKATHGVDLIPQFAFLAVMLEPVCRLTFHLGGLPVLQHGLTHNQQNEQFLDLRYFMLDQRGLLANDKITWLKAHLSAGDETLVDDVMRLAVKSRDAFAHGAIMSFTPNDRNAYSTPIALAIMLVLTAAATAAGIS